MIITLSRQYATNGVLIARSVAEQLKIPVYERELLNEVARLMQIDPVSVDRVFEQKTSFVESLVSEWLSSMSPESYLRYLRRALNAIYHRGDAVVVGRGGNLVLAEPDCLHIRIVAPMELRVAIFQVGNDLPEAEIKRIISQRDQARAQYIKNVFHQQIDDPHNYDLTINLQAMTPEHAVEHIVLAAKARKDQQLSSDEEATMPHHLRMMIKARHHVRPEIIERERKNDRHYPGG